MMLRNLNPVKFNGNEAMTPGAYSQQNPRKEKLTINGADSDRSPMKGNRKILESASNQKL
jgi:hypothetical protein